MEKEFIPYEQALALKELGFDEPCFGYFDPLLGDYVIINNDCINPKPTLFNHNLSSIVVSAPLYQQAFRWFREKGFEINFTFHKEYLENGDKNVYEVNVEDINSSKVYFITPLNGFKSYEEAELECLKKLIEIVKKQQEYESNIIV